MCTKGTLTSWVRGGRERDEIQEVGEHPNVGEYIYIYIKEFKKHRKKQQHEVTKYQEVAKH